jgi:hypothetical protein
MCKHFGDYLTFLFLYHMHGLRTTFLYKFLARSISKAWIVFGNGGRKYFDERDYELHNHKLIYNNEKARDTIDNRTTSIVLRP